MSVVYQVHDFKYGCKVMFTILRCWMVFCLPCLIAFGGTVRTVSTAQQLQEILRTPVDSLEIVLAPGEYHLTPFSYIDSTCGNCQDPNTLVTVTIALHVRGSFVRISGPPDKSSIVYTNAG